MVVVEGHLVDVAKHAPVDEVADKAGKSSDAITLDLLERHMNVLGCNLLRGVVQRLTKVLRLGTWTRTVFHPTISVGCSIERRVSQIAVTMPVIRILWVPAYRGKHSGLVLPVSLLQLFIARVGDDINREVLDELGKVTSDVSNGDVQGLLNLNEPVTLGDLLGWKEVLLLRHLREGIRVDGSLRGQQ